MWTFKVATICHYKLVFFRKAPGNKVAVTPIKKTMSQIKEHLFYNLRHKEATVEKFLSSYWNCC